MKLDIQNYIQGCLQCQLKKLIRVKTKNPMVITDTPTTAFEKISMDIVGPLPETKIYCDRKINPLEVKIGDNVFLFKGGKIKKLDNYYIGP